MLKLSVAAVVSIAYCFSTLNIAEAKQQPANKKLSRNLSCESQPSNIPQLNSISTADIKAICQILTKKYIESNRRSINRERNPGYEQDRNELLAWEVKKVNLVSASNSGSESYANIDIQYVVTSYQYDNNMWKMQRASTESQIVAFYKKGGKWNYERTIRSGMMGL